RRACRRGRARSGHERRGQARGTLISQTLSPEVAKPVVLLIALAIDLALGDPPNPYHPVAWLGRLLAAGRRRLCGGSPARLLVSGAALTLGVAGLAGWAGAYGSELAARLGYAGLMLQALALTCLLSVLRLLA